MITPSDALTKIPRSWREMLSDHDGSEIDRQLSLINAALRGETEKGARIYPWACERFKALELTPPSDTRVVILGQDPYHNLCKDLSGLERPQAMGLSFSVPKGAKIPPSLKNIFKELNADNGITVPDHGDLTSWATQGVLLLNSYLSVRHGEPGSHANLGWSEIVQLLIKAISAREGANLAFILWGKHAQLYEEHILNADRHLIIKTSHPSPIGGACNKGFFGSKPFSKVNSFLQSQGAKAIDWNTLNHNGEKP